MRFVLLYNRFHMDELRKDIRFADFGRVDCPALSPIPGVLSDVSEGGLKATFPVPVEIDMSDMKKDEFELSVRLSSFGSVSLDLLAIPVWVFNNNSGGNSSTQIGFSLLPAKDFGTYSEYIKKMDESAAIDDEQAQRLLNDVVNEILPEETSCQIL